MPSQMAMQAWQMPYPLTCAPYSRLPCFGSTITASLRHLPDILPLAAKLSALAGILPILMSFYHLSNLPAQISRLSLVFSLNKSLANKQFEAAIAKMLESGEIDDLYRKHLGISYHGILEQFGKD